MDGPQQVFVSSKVNKAYSAPSRLSPAGETRPVRSLLQAFDERMRSVTCVTFNDLCAVFGDVRIFCNTAVNRSLALGSVHKTADTTAFS